MARTTKSLPRYSIDFLDADGRSTGTQYIEAANDAEAIRIARQIPDLQDIELWHGKRLVVRFEARPAPKE
jgi:hypothetical protein